MEGDNEMSTPLPVGRRCAVRECSTGFMVVSVNPVIGENVITTHNCTVAQMANAFDYPAIKTVGVAAQVMKMWDDFLDEQDRKKKVKR